MSVGIDFGTTNSAVAKFAAGSTDILAIDEPPANWAGLGFDRVLPTVFGRGNEDQPIFGWAAKQRTGSLAAVKRLFRAEERAEVDGVEYSVEEIATLIFGHLKRAAASQGVAFDQAVVTIPANSRGLARYRTKLCAGMAGIQVMALVNEPTAAAMAYSMQSSHGETLMVLDWGGGTFDVTILHNEEGIFMEQASSGIQKLGGLDLDHSLSRVVLATVNNSSWSGDDRQAFRLDIEKAKIELSSLEHVNVPLPKGEYRSVSREMLEGAVRQQIERIREPIERCLRDSKLRSSELDAIVLVGGTCKMPAVRRFVQDVLEKSPAPGLDPMTAVAQGAAIAAAILSGELPDRDFFVSTEHALGTVVLNPEHGLEFSELIPRNHKLPARATDTYSPVRDYQDKLEIRVVEGDPSKPLDHEDNVVMKSWTVELPDPQPLGELSVDLMYSYDVDGILHVNASDSLGNRLLEEVVSYGINLDPRDRVDIAQRTARALDQHRIEPPRETPASNLDPETRRLAIEARTKIIPFIDHADGRLLTGVIERVEGGDSAAIGELQAAIKKYSYLL